LTGHLGEEEVWSMPPNQFLETWDYNSQRQDHALKLQWVSDTDGPHVVSVMGFAPIH
jgi:hypothetical protein